MTAPVVMLHGLATSAQRTWIETGWVDLLADAGRTVVAIDLPGHGGTPVLSDWSILEDWVSQQITDRCGEGPIDAIGFSLGARILLVLASRQPDRFARLVLAGAGANLFRHDDTGSLAMDMEAADLDEHPLARHFLGMAESSGTDPEAVRALLRRRQPPLIDDELRAINSDVVLVMGTDDFAGPATPLAERLRTVRTVELRGVDHFATPKAMGFLDAGLAHLDA